MCAAIFSPQAEYDLKALDKFAPEIRFKTLKIDHTNIPKLQPEEWILLSDRATATRKAQFSFGREAAKLALRELNLTGEISIGKGSSREPIFPSGFIGSIAHSAEVAFAAVARVSSICGIGIDLEKISAEIDRKIIEHIATADERGWILADGECVTERMLAIFSAKESIYKALNPMLKRYIGFKEVNLIWNQEQSAFQITALAKLQADLANLSLSPVWVKREGELLFSCVVVCRRI